MMSRTRGLCRRATDVPIAVRGFHQDEIGLGRRRGLPEQGSAPLANITGKHHQAPAIGLLHVSTMLAEPSM